MNAGDYIEFFIKCTTTSDVYLSTLPANGTSPNNTPASPSIIVTYMQAAYNGPTGPTGPSLSSVIYGTTSTYALAAGIEGQNLTIINNSTGATGLYVSGSFINSNNGATGTTMRATLQYNAMSMIYSTTFNRWLILYSSSGVTGPF